MKGITIKLPDTMLHRLRQEARTTGRSVAALIREKIEAVPHRGSRSIYEITADLAGSVAGSRKPATNGRRRFARS
jgi:predicted transcriptional regulator